MGRIPQSCSLCQHTTHYFCAECGVPACRRCRAVRNGNYGNEHLCLDCCGRLELEVVVVQGIGPYDEQAAFQPGEYEPSQDEGDEDE